MQHLASGWDSSSTRPCSCAHVQKAHGPIRFISWAEGLCGRQAWAKMHYLWHLWPVSNDLKHIEASFFSDSDRSVRLQVAQVPRSSKLAIFVLTTTIDIQTDCFTPCTCMQGNHIIFLHRWDCNAKEYKYKDQTQLHPCVATSVNVHEGHTMQW